MTETVDPNLAECDREKGAPTKTFLRQDNVLAHALAPAKLDLPFTFRSAPTTRLACTLVPRATESAHPKHTTSPTDNSPDTIVELATDKVEFMIESAPIDNDDETFIAPRMEQRPAIWLSALTETEPTGRWPDTLSPDANCALLVTDERKDVKFDLTERLDPTR